MADIVLPPLAAGVALLWTALVWVNYWPPFAFELGDIPRAFWPVGISPDVRGIFDAFAGHLHHGIVAALILLAARGMGRPARRFLAAPSSPFLRLGLGLVIIGHAVLGLGLAGLLRPPLLWALAAAGAVAGGLPRRPFAFPPGLSRPFIIFVIAASLPALAGALAPEVTYDALAYHLGAPAQFLKIGKVVRLDHMFFSDFPLGLQMAYGAAMGLGGGGAAKLMHWALGFLCLAAAARLGERAGGYRAAGWAAAFTASAALVTTQMMKANVDLGVVLLTLAGLLVLLDARGSAGLLAAGICFGGAASVKLTGGLGIVAGLILVVMKAGRESSPSPAGRERESGPERVREPAEDIVRPASPPPSPSPLPFRERAQRGVLNGAIGMFLAGAALPLAAWLVRSWLFTGNPVYPFLWRVLGGLGWSAENAAAYRFDMTGTTSFNVQYPLATGRLAGPWLAFMHDRGGEAALGPFALTLVPLALWSWRRLSAPARAMGVFALAYWLGWFASVRDARFFLPAVPVAAAFIAVVLGGIAGAPGAVLRLACAASFAFAPFRAASVAYRTVNPAAVVWGAVPAGYFVEKLVPPPGSVRLARLASSPEAGGHVLVIGDVKAAEVAPRALYQSMFDTPHITAAVREEATSNRLAVWFKERGVGTVIYNRGGALYLKGQFGHFNWTSRERTVLKGFFERYLLPVREEKEKGETVMGLYRVAPRPGPRRPLPLPGDAE